MTEDRPSAAVEIRSKARGVDIVARFELLVAILLSVTFLFFLVIRATHSGALWRDEAATVQLAQMPTISDIAKNFTHEAFPIPFPLLLRGYAAIFGGSDGSFRWLGFAVGLALIVAAWFNSRASNDRGPLLFLSLFCLNATFLTWGTSVRGYGIGCVFLVLTIGLTAKAIRQPTIGAAIAATIAAIGSVQFMVNAVPLIAAVALSAALSFAAGKQFRNAAIVCICGAVCALSFVPYLSSYLGADWNIVLKYPTDFSSLWEKFHLALQEHAMLGALLWYLATPLIIVVAIWRWWSIRKQTDGPSPSPLPEGEADSAAAGEGIWHRQPSAKAIVLLFLVASPVFSLAAYYAFLKILSYATRPWYYLPLLCAVAAVLDLTATTLSRMHWFRIARLLFAITARVFLPFQVWSVSHQRLTDIDILASKLQKEAAPTDLIVLNPWHYAPSFYRYYHGPTPWITVPTMSEHRVHRYDLMKAKMLESDPLSDVRSAIQQTLQAGHRVWIVGGARPLDPNMPRLGPAPNPYFGWAGYMSYWSMEIGSFLKEHVSNGQVVIEPMPNVNDGENVPLLVANGWKD